MQLRRQNEMVYCSNVVDTMIWCTEWAIDDGDGGEESFKFFIFRVKALGRTDDDPKGLVEGMKDSVEGRKRLNFKEMGPLGGRDRTVWCTGWAIDDGDGGEISFKIFIFRVKALDGTDDDPKGLVEGMKDSVEGRKRLNFKKMGPMGGQRSNKMV